jgi:hypothetical protein
MMQNEREMSKLYSTLSAQNYRIRNCTYGDASSDETLELFEEFSNNYSNVKEW